MAERTVLAQDAPQYQQSIAPEKRRELETKYKSDLKDYEIKLAEYDKGTASYEKALTAYESEITRQAELKAADEKRIADEKAKVTADQKRLTDLQKNQQSKIDKINDSRTIAINKHHTEYWKDGGRRSQGVGRAVFKEEQNAIHRNYNSQVDSLKRNQSVTYQQLAFSINYPNAGTFGGTWFRDWQRNPFEGSLSSRYSSELTRRTTQAQRSRELSIKQAQSDAIISAKLYSVDVGAYTKSITNFGGTDIRELSRSELERRSKIKPLAPIQIAVIGRKQLQKAVNRPTYTGVSFDRYTPALLLRQKEEKALTDFYQQYKAPTPPPSNILEGVVEQSTGKKVTKETMIKIQGLTAKPDVFEYSRAAVYTHKQTGEKFDASTGKGSIKIASALGYTQSQNMQQPEYETSFTIVGLPQSKPTPKQPPQKLIDMSIEKSLRVIENEQIRQPDNPVTAFSKSLFLEGGKEVLSTVGYLSNVWHEKVQTLHFRGEQKGLSITKATKLDYTSPYGFLGTLGKSVYEGLEGKSTLSFDKPYVKSMAIPITFTQTAIENPQGIPSYLEKYGYGSPIGASVILLAGGKPSLAIPKAIKESKPFIQTFFKQESLGSSTLVKKSPIEIAKGALGKEGFKHGQLPKWQTVEIVQRTKDWSKLTPLQQHMKLRGRAQNAAELHQKLMDQMFMRGEYTPRGNVFIDTPKFTSTSLSFGTSLAGAIAKGDATKPRSLSTLYDDLPYKPTTRSTTEIDFTDAAVPKPTYTYVEPKAPTKSITDSRYAPKRDDPINLFIDEARKAKKIQRTRSYTISYHGTDLKSAKNILKHGIDQSKPFFHTKDFKYAEDIGKDLKKGLPYHDPKYKPTSKDFLPSEKGVVLKLESDSKGIIVKITGLGKTWSAQKKLKQDDPINLFRKTSKTETKQPKRSDVPDGYREVRTSGGLSILQKVEQKTIQKTVQKTIQKTKQVKVQKTKQIRIQKQKSILKTRQKLYLGIAPLSTQTTKQKTKQIQVFKQKQQLKQQQDQLYKQTTMQKFEQAKKLIQAKKLKQRTLLRTKLQTAKTLKTKMILDTPVIPKTLKMRIPQRDPTSTRRRLPIVIKEKKKLRKTKQKIKKVKPFIGNVSEVSIIGVYDRSELIYGKKKVTKLSKKDIKKYLPEAKKTKKVKIL